MSEAGVDALAAATVRVWRAPEHRAGHGGGPLTASQLAAIEEQAYREGFERGLDEGRRQGAAEVGARARRLGELFAAIEPQSNLLDETLLEQLGDLVLAITRQFVRRELARAPGEVVRVVREAVAALPVSTAEIRIALHPEDATLVAHELAPDTHVHRIRVVEDVTVSRGGARVETDVSVVDATVESRLGAIAAGIFGDDRQPDMHGESQ